MFCIGCGKLIPDDVNFCAYCGKPQKTEEVKLVEWEYEDFTVTFGKKPASLKGTDAEARFWFWSCYQAEILSLLQQWFDSGWQALSEVGPSAFVTRSYFRLYYDKYVPVEFRVKMRRRKA